MKCKCLLEYKIILSTLVGAAQIMIAKIDRLEKRQNSHHQKESAKIKFF